MFRCPACHDAIPGDRARVGARCPYCREPLYENPQAAARAALEGPAAGRCAAHPNNPALGTCQRCGNFLCVVCRTRWRDRALCAACVDRALEANEAAPAAARIHFRQAVLATVLGVLSWIGIVLAFLVISQGANQGSQGLIGLGVILFLATPGPAVFGVGQGAAALRDRGDHMILATIGLILSGLYAGLFVGTFTVLLWMNR